MEILTPADYHSGARKRPRRSGRPCDACRKRKTRCVLAAGGGRQCVHCQLRGSPCTFEREPPERTTSNPALSGDHPDDVRAARTEEPMSVSDAPSPTSADRAEVIAGYSTDEGRKAAASGSAASVSEFVPDDAMTLGLAHRRFAELYGLGSDMEPILMVRRFSFSQGTSTGTVREQGAPR